MVENVLREDLGPIEEATAFQRMIDQFGLTQEEVAQVVGRDRSTVANSIRLLGLPDEVKEHLENGRLRPGHARALLALPTAAARIAAARTVVRKGLSVRQTESLVKKTLGPAPVKSEATRRTAGYLTALADQMKLKYGTRVDIKGRLERGRIVFEYYSKDELDRLLELLTK